jgi:D-glycero-D-manno-heptose 1,7-bisphosphate phosphatase
MVKQAPQLKPAVFLDRDGVLNKDVGYVYRPEDLLVLPGVAESLTKIKAQGFLLIVITNQSGVARGKFDLDAVSHFNSLLTNEICRLGGPALDGFYICPHHPDGIVEAYKRSCDCRKPEPGLILQAAKEHGIDLKKSWMIGDKDSDVICAANAGVRGILTRSEKYQHNVKDTLNASDINDALRHIIGA